MNCATCQIELTEDETKQPRNQVNANMQQIPICTACQLKALKTASAKFGFRLGA